MDQVDKDVVEAIDYALTHTLRGCNDPHRKPEKSYYSCIAVNIAIERLANKKFPNTSWRHRGKADSEYTEYVEERLDWQEKVEDRFGAVVNQMGLYANCWGNPFDDMKDGKKKQLARALWLTNVKHAIVEGLI
jgi:hypothetical protein